MSNKKLFGLGIAAVVMIVLAVIQANIANRESNIGAVTSTYLIQGLDPARIARIEIVSGESTMTLIRKGKGFLVTNKDNYPAKVEQINDLLTGVMDIKVRDRITDNPENFADLGVTEEKARNIIKFFDNENKVITGVVIGNQAESGESYVRQVSGENVYLGENVPGIRSEALDYIEQQLIILNKEDVVLAEVFSPDGNYTLKSEPNSMEVELVGTIPAGKKLKSDAKQVFTALANLRFTDVINFSKAAKDLAFDYSYICHFKDSTVCTLNIAKSDGKTYVKCSAKFTDTEKIEKARKIESEEELKRKEAKLLARQAAERFDKTHAGWVYVIADYNAKNLTKSLDDLLEDEEKSEPLEDVDSL